MKIILTLISTILVLAAIACDNSSSDKSSPDTSSTITVTINYLGNYGGDYDPTTNSSNEPREGEKINYLQIYDSMTDISTTFDKKVPYKEFQINVNNTPTGCTGIKAGTYYLVAIYDYRTGGDETNKITQGDRYAIYDGGTGSPLAAAAQQVTINESSSYDFSFTIQPYWELRGSKVLLSTLTGNTLTINVDYTTTGTDDVYAFVYHQLEPDSPRNNILYQGSVSGGTGIITIPNILTQYGTNFYVCCLLNTSASGSNVINQTDKYEIFADTQSPTGTPTIVNLAADAEITLDDAADLFTIGTGATWQP